MLALTVLHVPAWSLIQAAALTSAAPLYAALGTIATAVVIGVGATAVRQLGAISTKLERLDVAVRGIEGTNGLVGTTKDHRRAIHDLRTDVQAHDLELERLHLHVNLSRRSDR
jgi:hypothetical protein